MTSNTNNKIKHLPHYRYKNTTPQILIMHTNIAALILIQFHSPETGYQNKPTKLEQFWILTMIWDFDNAMGLGERGY